MTHEDLGEKLRQLSLEGYTGNITFSFHKGSLSHKVKFEYVEETKSKTINSKKEKVQNK